MADINKRWLLKAGVAAGCLAGFGVSYRDVAKRALDGLVNGTSGKPTLDRINGNSLLPEGKKINGQWQPNPDQAICMTQCVGCWTQCGIRVRVDRQHNRVLRIAGNPYHPLSQERQFPWQMPLIQAFSQMGGESGLNDRSTACARGATLMESLYSPVRILSPMKRAGKRGEGKWQHISFEQLIDEVVEGGDLFGEGHVQGLRALRDLKTLIDEQQPSLGPRVNQVLITNTGEEGRDSFFRRFAMRAYGSKNFGAHGSYCGLAFRAGSGALMNDLDKNAHAKPDWEDVHFALFMGTSPAQSGNPFKRQARQLGHERTRDSFHYVVVAPALPLTTTLANDHGHWLPVLPGTDSALAMGMIRWIIENQRYNADYLTIPSEQAMDNAGEKSWTNATHLVISNQDHPFYGQLLTRAHLDGSEEKDSPYLIVNGHDELVDSQQANRGQLFVTRAVTLHDGSKITIKSSFQCLKESAGQLTLEQYSQHCGVPVEKIVALAKTFTSYGRKVAVITHGGMMAGNGFYNAWAVLMLNALAGNLGLKGGIFVGGGKFDGAGDGPRYKLKSFAGSVKPKGINYARSKEAYEKSDEYRLKQAAGQNPYPAKGPWYPFVGGQLSEQLVSALSGYPYPIKAWISNMTNPLYGIAGARQLTEERIKDTSKLPLFVAIDAFMNETTALADYIVPDTHNFESWGFSAPWAGVASKASTARWPIVESINERTADGQPVSMETFCITVAKKIGLPGFGDNAIEDNDGNHYPLNCAEDYYLRMAANIAFMGEKPAPPASEQEIRLAGVDRILPAIKRTLKAEETDQVAFIYTRGGRFASYESGIKGNSLGKAWKPPLQIWNPLVAVNRHALTGEHYSGCPRYYPSRLADGRPVENLYPLQEWPLRLMSFKSNLMSSSSTIIERLHHVKPANIVAINPQDGAKFGIKHGDKVRISTPGGSVETTISLLSGVMPGVIAIEHGYGHWEMGSRQHYLDGKPMPVIRMISSGISLNDLGFTDPTRQVHSTWLDWVSGAAVRQGFPAKITRIS